MKKEILETTRLYLREMDEDDLPTLRLILQDAQVMTAYEHAFSEEEVQAWLANQARRYREDGFGLWAVCAKQSGEMLGQCGITWQSLAEKQVPEIGYLFAQKFWRRGYAIEAAKACRSYAFEKLGFAEVFSIIRDTNLASMNVAIRNGMLVRSRFTKQYYGMEMPHLVFSVKKREVCTGVEC